MVRKYGEKRRNFSLRAISPIPTVSSKTCTADTLKPRLVWERVNLDKPKILLSEHNFQFWVTTILSSANALNLDKSKILLSGKWLGNHPSEVTVKYVQHFRP